MSIEVSKDVQKAYELAKKARLNAHAPYSKFLVGAALKVKGEDKYYSGCNVENASFGGTVCAERNAIFKMVSEEGKKDFDFIVVVTDTTPASVPCGFCLQVMSEFSSLSLPVYLANLKGIDQKLTLKDFLPRPFQEF